MIRERALQVVLVGVGLFYSLCFYILFDDLWHSKWLVQEHNDVRPMFLCFMAALGPCLLMAVKHPSKHRLMIFSGAFASLVHASTMAIQSMQASAHGIHRQDSPQDIIIFAVIGLLLLALFPRKADATVAVGPSNVGENGVERDIAPLAILG
jgi:hypothetical protein